MLNHSVIQVNIGLLVSKHILTFVMMVRPYEPASCPSWDCGLLLCYPIWFLFFFFTFFFPDLL